MRPAIDASRALTVALTAAQEDTLKRLDDLAFRCSKQITRAHELLQENIRCMQSDTQETVDQLAEIRELALALRAEMLDGNDDMAKAMAKVFAPKLDVAPPDPETTALAQKLAPPVREAAA